MEKNNEHNSEEQAEERDFFNKVEVPFEESKEDIWAKLSKRIDETPIQADLKAEEIIKKEVKVVPFKQWKLAVAAVVIVLFGITSFMKLYSITVESNAGEHLSHILPDGSEVLLNAGSQLAYAPYWWSVSRALELEGEAYFKVQKGKRFTVHSEMGNTQVLGTSFNISTRNNTYEVLCTTGKVKVTSAQTASSVMLLPNEFVELSKDKHLDKKIIKNTASFLSWMDNEFDFIDQVFVEVIEEVARQYNVEIEIDVHKVSDLYYTGHFSRSMEVDSTLGLICETFGLNYTKVKEGSYRIK